MCYGVDCVLFEHAIVPTMLIVAAAAKGISTTTYNRISCWRRNIHILLHQNTTKCYKDSRVTRQQLQQPVLFVSRSCRRTRVGKRYRQPQTQQLTKHGLFTIHPSIISAPMNQKNYQIGAIRQKSFITLNRVPTKEDIPETTITTTFQNGTIVGEDVKTVVDIVVATAVDDNNNDSQTIGRNHHHHHHHQQHVQRRALLDAINQVVKKQKHFWTLEELKMQTQKLLDYCHHRNNNNNNNNMTPNDGGEDRPSEDTFYKVLEAWMEYSMNMSTTAAATQPGSTRGALDSAERARLLLDAMIPKRDMYQSNTSKRVFLQNLLTTPYYDVVLQAYAVSNAGLPAAIRAESLLLQMIQRRKLYMKQMNQHNRSVRNRNRRSNKLDGPPIPTLKTFNIVLNCWAKSCTYEAVDRINALVLLMEEWDAIAREMNHINGQKRISYNTGYRCLPNERSLLCLIEAWTNGRPNEAPDAVLRVLQELMIDTDRSDTTNHGDGVMNKNLFRYQNVKLDEAVFNAVIYSWVRSNRGREAALKAEEILQMMIQWSQVGSNNKVTVQPTTRTYSMVIMAWAECENVENSGDAARRAETILRKMVHLYSEGQGNAKPNSILFTSCVTAWSRAASNCVEAPVHAEELWNLLRKLYAETGFRDIELEPTTQIGNAVISSWSRCTNRSDSVERALGVLEILKQEKMDDLISYNTVLDAMSKKGCAHDAMKLLQWLDSSNDSSALVPDLITYNSVLSAFGRSSIPAEGGNNQTGDATCAAEEAEKLLRRMENLNSIKPNKLSYTAVMNAWARSDSPEKTQRASALLRDMIRQYESGNDALKPDVYVYTTFIKTCAHKRGGTKQENAQVLQMALNAMATLENTDFGPPNDVSYSTIMTAIYRLSDHKSNDQDRHYESAFRHCTVRGLLSNEVLRAFQRGASMRLFRRLTNNTGKLHPQWSRNVPHHKMPSIEQ